MAILSQGTVVFQNSEVAEIATVSLNKKSVDVTAVLLGPAEGGDNLTYAVLNLSGDVFVGPNPNETLSIPQLLSGESFIVKFTCLFD